MLFYFYRNSTLLVLTKKKKVHRNVSLQILPIILWYNRYSFTVFYFYFGMSEEETDSHEKNLNIYFFNFNQRHVHMNNIFLVCLYFYNSLKTTFLYNHKMQTKVTPQRYYIQKFIMIRNYHSCKNWSLNIFQFDEWLFLTWLTRVIKRITFWNYQIYKFCSRNCFCQSLIILNRHNFSLKSWIFFISVSVQIE